MPELHPNASSTYGIRAVVSLSKYGTSLSSVYVPDFASPHI